MESQFDVFKFIWDEGDFSRMGWHDANIYAMAFRGENCEFLLDIDYILAWVGPSAEKYYKFRVVPATLVFRNVWDLNIDLNGVDALEIVDLIRENPHSPKNKNAISESVEYDWIIETTKGNISFKSVGYTQYLRRAPVILDSQMIGLKERGGVCFDLVESGQ